MPAMPSTIDLQGRGPTTLTSALNEEKNVLSWATFGPATDRFYDSLWSQRSAIAAVVEHHLGLRRRAWPWPAWAAGRDEHTIRVLPRNTWIRGSFNVCVFVEIRTTPRAARWPWTWPWPWPWQRANREESSSGNRTQVVIVRCPMAHKLAEANYPGSIDEKLCCEVGAYAYVEAFCPEIRTPHLFGFGTAAGQSFTHVRERPLLTRAVRRVWQWIDRVRGRPLLSSYVPHPHPHPEPPPPPSRRLLDSAYMVLEYLGPGTGRMLSTTFAQHRHDEAKRRRLFRGMARILLSLARIPQPRIGSFAFNPGAGAGAGTTVALTNRPLKCTLILLENQGADRVLRPHDTYTSTDAYASDMVTFHDHAFLRKPNAATDEDDCRSQLAVRVLMRALAHRHIQREHRAGPYFVQLTDLHGSNLLVDDDWNVTGLIDLEWICALPVEELCVPYWLTGCSIDEIEDEEYDKFDRVRREFMSVLEELEMQEAQRRRPADSTHGVLLSRSMHAMWESKSVWFWYGLSSVNGMYSLLDAHLVSRKQFTFEAEMVVSRFWADDVDSVVARKLAEKEAYDAEIRKLFGAEPETEAS